MTLSFQQAATSVCSATSSFPVVTLTFGNETVVDEGVGLVVRRSPLHILTASHVAALLELGEADSVRVDGQDLGKAELVNAPALQADEAVVIRFATALPSKPGRAGIPKLPPQVSEGDVLELVSADNGSRRTQSGRVYDLREDGRLRSFSLDTPITFGHSGSPIFRKGQLCAVCQGKEPGAPVSNAIAIRLGSESLHVLRDLSFRFRRVVRTAVTLGLIALLGLVLFVGARSVLTFDVGDIALTEDRRTLVVQNRDWLTFRSRWTHTFPSPISYFQALQRPPGDGSSHILVGTFFEGEEEGRLFCLTEHGRIAWDYTVSQTELEHGPDPGNYSGYNARSTHPADLDSDGTPEIIATFSHMRWFPCHIIALDLDGREIGALWHPGFTYFVEVGMLGSSDEPLIVVGAVNNKLRSIIGSINNPSVVFAVPSGRLLNPENEADGTPYAWYVCLPPMDGEQRAEICDLRIIDLNGDGQTIVSAGMSDGCFYNLDATGHLVGTDTSNYFDQVWGDVEIPRPVRIDVASAMYEWQ